MGRFARRSIIVRRFGVKPIGTVFSGSASERLSLLGRAQVEAFLTDWLLHYDIDKLDFFLGFSTLRAIV